MRAWLKSRTWWRRIWFVVLGAWLLVGVAMLGPLEPFQYFGVVGNSYSRRAHCINNIRQLAMALKSYNDQYGSLPPAYTVDADGQPLHSWRTLLLPYMDRNDIYESIRLDEPWDSPFNSTFNNGGPFADIGLEIITCPSDIEANSIPQTMTSYVVVVGPETAFPGSETVSLDDITDGATNTLLIVEVANSGHSLDGAA